MTDMKTLTRLIMGLMALLMIPTFHLTAQVETPTGDFITVEGLVRDKESKKKLEYVNITVAGTNIGTVTNADGAFSIKIQKAFSNRPVEVSHIGYLNTVIPLSGKDISGYTVYLEPNPTSLDEVIIRGGDARPIVLEAMSKIPANYPATENLLTGFYRETAQKGRRYITISEAIIDIYKTAYKRVDASSDRVQILKGRKLLSPKVSDTLIVKLLGGPNLSLYVDIVKNPYLLLDPELMPYYAFRLEGSTVLDERPHYVIDFQPQASLPYALYKGKLYIDKKRLSFSRAEFELDMSDRLKATDAILKKKPFGLRFRPIGVTYLVTYSERQGVTWLNYIRNEIRFKCDWKRKLFSTNYTMTSEMVVTDGKMAEERIPYKISFKSNQSLSDKVSDFADEQFWGDYNIIEPTESLENAVHKLKKWHEKDKK